MIWDISRVTEHNDDTIGLWLCIGDSGIDDHKTIWTDFVANSCEFSLNQGSYSV